MSQSAALYRVSNEIFSQLATSKERGQFNIHEIAKSYTVFQESFMELEFVLSKGQLKETADLIAEIFNPTQALGIEQLNHEDVFTLYESGQIMSYLDSNTVSKINGFLKTLTIDRAIACYNSDELNKNGIYPEQWKAGNSREEAFNERCIVEGIKDLKDIFEAADLDHDSIFVFIG